jgi:pilus assembly protein CpaF
MENASRNFALDDLLADSEITEILVNGAEKVWVEKNGKLELINTSISPTEELRNWIRTILSNQGKRMDFRNPFSDAILPCGSRMHVIGAPVASGIILSIRKFAKEKMNLDRLFDLGSMSEKQRKYLQLSVEQKKNIFVSGGTGSGKTTLLSALLSQVDSCERIIAIEDIPELTVNHEHFLSLQTRNANQEGEGEISIADLMKQTLRMRPDRLVIGECRGSEALQLLLMLNTGHMGSMGTIHANGPREAIHRLETLAMLGAQNFPFDSIRRLICGAVQVIVHLEKRVNGRGISNIAELKGYDGGNYLLKEIGV